MDEKSKKLLEEDLEKHPTATLAQRCEYLRVVAGIEVSRSVICRSIKKMERTRKKGDEPPPSARSLTEPPGG